MINTNAKITEIQNRIVSSDQLSEHGWENAVYEFKCPSTNREFLIRYFDEDGFGYFMVELVPMELWDANLETAVFQSQFDLVKWASTPNTFTDELLRSIISEPEFDRDNPSRYMITREMMDLHGTRDPIFLNSLDECAEAIYEALKDNTYYKHLPPEEEITLAEKIEHANRSIQSAKLILNAIATVEPSGVFKGTFLIPGVKLSGKLKADLHRYFTEPSYELWSRLHTEYVVHTSTLGDAWKAYQSSGASKSENLTCPRIPDSEELQEAIRACVEDTREQAEGKLDYSTERLKNLKAELYASQGSLRLVANNPPKSRLH